MSGGVLVWLSVCSDVQTCVVDIEKYIYIVASEMAPMANPENRHSAYCVGTLSYPRNASGLLRGPTAVSVVQLV